MRAINFLLAAGFMVLAFLQVEERDAFVWILIYGAMTIVCIMAMFEVYYKSVLLILTVVFSVYCFFLFPGFRTWLQQENMSLIFDARMKSEHPYIKDSREFISLGICLLVLVFHFFQSLRIK